MIGEVGQVTFVLDTKLHDLATTSNRAVEVSMDKAYQGKLNTETIRAKAEQVDNNINDFLKQLDLTLSNGTMKKLNGTQASSYNIEDEDLEKKGILLFSGRSNERDKNEELLRTAGKNYYDSTKHALRMDQRGIFEEARILEYHMPSRAQSMSRRLEQHFKDRHLGSTNNLKVVDGVLDVIQEEFTEKSAKLYGALSGSPDPVGWNVRTLSTLQALARAWGADLIPKKSLDLLDVSTSAICVDLNRNMMFILLMVPESAPGLEFSLYTIMSTPLPVPGGDAASLDSSEVTTLARGRHSQDSIVGFSNEDLKDCHWMGRERVCPLKNPILRGHLDRVPENKYVLGTYCLNELYESREKGIMQACRVKTATSWYAAQHKRGAVFAVKSETASEEDSVQTVCLNENGEWANETTNQISATPQLVTMKRGCRLTSDHVIIYGRGGDDLNDTLRNMPVKYNIKDKLPMVASWMIAQQVVVVEITNCRHRILQFAFLFFSLFSKTETDVLHEQEVTDGRGGRHLGVGPPRDPASIKRQEGLRHGVRDHPEWCLRGLPPPRRAIQHCPSDLVSTRNRYYRIFLYLLLLLLVLFRSKHFAALQIKILNPVFNSG